MASSSNSLGNTIAQLEKILKDGLSTLAPTGQPAITSGQVSWYGAPFTTPTNKPWLRTSSVAVGPIQQSTSDCYSLEQAFFIVDVFYPANQGYKFALEIANNVKLLYRNDLSLNFHIESVTVQPNNTSLPQWFSAQVTVTYNFETHVED